jgi:hypothetical protein
MQEWFDGMEDRCGPAVEGGAIALAWSAKGIGFGQVVFYEQNGKLMCDNELMSKEFIKRMLCKMVDDCEMNS